MILPLADIVGMWQQGVGNLLRETGLTLMQTVMEEEVRHLAGERHQQHEGRRAHRWGKEDDAKKVIAQIASPDVKSACDTFVVGPKAPTQQDYETAMKQSRPALQAAYRDYFRAHNVAAIVFPTTLLPARPIGDDDEVELNGKKVSTFGIYLHNTRPITTAGIPGMSLPVGLTAAGLPVELDAPQGKDRNLLSLGLAIEKLFGRLPAPPV